MTRKTVHVWPIPSAGVEIRWDQTINKWSIVSGDRVLILLSHADYINFILQGSEALVFAIQQLNQAASNVVKLTPRKRTTRKKKTS